MGVPGEHSIVDEHGNRVAVILCRSTNNCRKTFTTLLL